VKLAEETKKVPLFEGNTDKQVVISALLNKKTKNNLLKFLCDNSDIFAWSPTSKTFAGLIGP